MMFRVLFLICLLRICHAPATAQAQVDQLDGLNTQAYLSLMDGDRALREQSPAQARDFYVKSLELYREISRVDPEYKSRIVGFRIEDLQAKLAKLPSAEGTQAPAAPAETNAEDYKQLYISAKEENVQLSTRLLGVEKRGVELERSLRERDQILEAQRQELVAVNRQLKEGLGESSQEIARLKRDLQDLRKFNGLLQERATELEQGFQANQAALDKTKDDYAAKDLDLQKLRGEFADLVEELARTRTQGTQGVERLQITLRQREDFLIQVQAEAVAAQQAAEFSDKELAVTRANLVRLQREQADVKAQWLGCQSNLVVAQAQTVSQAESLAEMDQALRAASAEADMLREKIAVGEATIGNLERSLVDVQKHAETNKVLLARIQELEAGDQGRETAWQAERGRMEAQLAAITDQLNQTTLLRREVDSLRGGDSNHVAKVQALEAQINEQTQLMQRLTQDADVSRGEREQLSMRLESMRNERIDLLSALQEKDEQLIALVTRSGEASADAWRGILETLSPKREPLELKAPGGKVLRVVFPDDATLPPVPSLSR